MAHIIPIRRCNLSCTYCNEYDDFSKPVPTEVMIGAHQPPGRSGHQHSDAFRRRADAASRSRRDHRGHAAARRDRRHDHQRLSADAGSRQAAESRRAWITCRSRSTTSSRTMCRRRASKSSTRSSRSWPSTPSFTSISTRWSAAAFTIRTMRWWWARRAMELGFSSTVGIIHDGDGQLRPLGDRERAVYHEMKAMENRHFARLNFFQDAIAQGKPNNWRCRAGARYMYICEDGLVHYCSQQRGYPAKPLDRVHARRYSPRVSHREVLRPVLHRELRALRFVLRFLAESRRPSSRPCRLSSASRW